MTCSPHTLAVGPRNLASPAHKSSVGVAVARALSAVAAAPVPVAAAVPVPSVARTPAVGSTQSAQQNFTVCRTTQYLLTKGNDGGPAGHD